MVALLAASNPSATNSSHPGPSLEKSSTVLSDGSSGTPSKTEGESLIEIFTTRMVNLFPFVVVPSYVTAEQLRRERPFLFLSLSMVACQNASRQREIATTVKEYVAEHIVLRNERSLDLLQGLIVSLAWFIGVSRQPRSNAPGQVGEVMPELTSQINQGPAQLDVFMQLAMAQITSLGLSQGTNPPTQMSKPISYIGKMDALADPKRVHTLEERRAYLGCYYLTVMYASQPSLFTLRS